MIINAAKIYSTLGNPSSRIPLMVKDLSATAGMTAGSFITGKEEGQDRFIDEMGTEIIWLGGIPFFQWAIDKTAYKAMGIDSKFDARNLKNKELFEKVKEYAPTEEIKKSIENAGKKSKMVKGAAITKFVVSTALAVGSYIGLTKFKQNYTAKKIEQNLIHEYQQSQQNEKNKTSSPSFKGIGKVFEEFAYNPVKNMWILDGCITAERLRDSRTPQEVIGYSIKEASTICFMYYAGGKIQELLEKHARNKYNKSIGLDARVLEGGMVKKAFEDGSIEKSFAEFEKVKNNKVAMYEFLHKNPDNIIVKTAKESDIIKLYKKTEKIDTRKFIDLKDIEGINHKLSELYKQYKAAISKGESSEKFFKGVKKLKRNSINMNIAISIFALGILTPGIMLAKRLSGKDDTEFKTKNEIRQQLIEKGIIS